jgi:HK97 family phage major capsid protein
MTEELNVEAVVAKALESFEARQAAVAAKEAEKQALIDEGKKLGKAEAEEALKAWKEEKGEVAIKQITKPGSGGTPEGGDMETFRYWMKTGDDVAARKSLTEVNERGEARPAIGTDKKTLSGLSGAAGEYLIPDDFVAGIIAKRDPLSFPRRMGVTVRQTNLHVLNLPAEDTSLTKFTRQAELGTFTTNDPTFKQNLVTVEKWTKNTNISQEQLDDDVSGLEPWFQAAMARAMAATEAYYVAIGNGTSQHEGIFEGGTTDAITFSTTTGGYTSDSKLGADMPWLLYFTLGSGYRDNAKWLAADTTLAAIAAMGNTVLAPSLVYGSINQLNYNAASGQFSLLGKDFYTQNDIPAIGSDGFIAFGDPSFYVLVERQGLTMARNPYLHMATGQVDFFCSFRQSGKVTNADAWVCGTL